MREGMQLMSVSEILKAAKAVRVPGQPSGRSWSAVDVTGSADGPYSVRGFPIIELPEWFEHGDSSGYIWVSFHARKRDVVAALRIAIELAEVQQ